MTQVSHNYEIMELKDADVEVFDCTIYSRSLLFLVFWDDKYVQS